ncbi:MAG TPA: SIS domain-containing protein, partial [Anaerolineaceae bacterium]|nr:SIS domain-containing protein [Anaerolineaceae bacterium]
MSNPFYRDILNQPDALRNLIHYYSDDVGRELLTKTTINSAENLILTGMGASYHAIMSVLPILHLNKIPAIAIESTDLMNYSIKGLAENSTIIFASQSGASGEVLPIVQQTDNVIAVTNDDQSPLAQNSRSLFPIIAGVSESGVACSTYCNMIATLWILTRAWTKTREMHDWDRLYQIADRLELLLKKAPEMIEKWMEIFQNETTPIFIGHGPHYATARQTAMMLGEWAKLPAISYGLGAFRHGPIEFFKPGTGVIIFSSPGISQTSAYTLATELSELKANVLLVENGFTMNFNEKSSDPLTFDEFLI